MCGYYDDIERTQDIITSLRWLMIDDEGKMDQSGYVYFVKRQKGIVTRDGVNIYPVEVDNTIAEHPHVLNAQIYRIDNELYGEDVCVCVCVFGFD
ncbi:unnamed protein product [Rotaria socialis]|uniref:Uncharacterized protein n=1 Tax=Rotaria socialis TaxID=392032 RepID=A0A818HWN9_9BILA|nr:unnamed protein product [Rotaria socialis]CAF3510767.1 unnamed protein product [Rotaria socialis]CAF3596225.1 unnamed protein product [Rotaria socialis]CAF4159713.1 unnamed protein product [Rotaria socialis]CAF4236141.1 unnamed protein product [Rotaria socialis]